MVIIQTGPRERIVMADTDVAVDGPAHLMHELDNSGDTRVTWDPDNEDEVSAARDTFNRLTKQGYKAFRATSSGDKTGDLLREFDPQARRIVLFKRLVGG